MARAYVLATANPGEVQETLEHILKVEGVLSAETVIGPYDLIALVQAADFDQLGRLVVGKIQEIGGITSTLTCPIVKL